MPRWSVPIEYVPVKLCAASLSVGLAPLTSISPFVRFPAPSAVNLPTAAKTVKAPPPPVVEEDEDLDEEQINADVEDDDEE